MTNKIDIGVKSLLAKLLACESINVIHDNKAKTASFSPKTRTLKLPILKDMQGYHYDGYIGHEVAHALYTPYDEKVLDELKEKSVPFSFVNITEDARIERLIQQKYPGLKKDFYHMYKDFSDPSRDMFGLKNMKVNEATLIDKINLFFKIGNFVRVEFKPEEKKFVEMTNKTLTFRDAVDTAIAIYNYMKDNNQLPPPSEGDEGESDEDGEGETGDGSGTSGKSKGKGKGNSSKDGKQNPGFTIEEFEKNRDDAVLDKEAEAEKTVCGELMSDEEFDLDVMVDTETYEKLKRKKPDTIHCDNFLKMVRPTVNMMANQFALRKAARTYEKTQESKSGKLNVKELSKYKISADIFLRNEIVYEDKNHGFMFYIDWSGSMKSNIFDTYKQLIVLLEFCNRINLPYEVYGFTTGEYRNVSVPVDKISPSAMRYNKVFKLLDSSDGKKAYQKNSAVIFECIRTDKIEEIHQMGSTPIMNTAFISDGISRKFIKKHNRDKNFIVVLTDGGTDDYLTKSNSSNCIVTNKLTMKNYRIESYHDLFKYVKDKNGIAKMIGFYLTDYVTQSVADIIAPKAKNVDKVIADFKKNHYAAFENGVAFDKFFTISMKNFHISDRGSKEFDKINPRHVKNDKEVTDAYTNKLNSMVKPMVFMKEFINLIG